MEEQKLIISTISKQMNGGVEDVFDTNNFIKTIDNIDVIKRKIVYRGMWLTVDKDTFATKVEDVEGEYSFVYNEENEQWYIKEDELTQVVDLAEYGITLNDGEKGYRDEITVLFFGGDIVWYGYLQADKLIDQKSFNYISFASEKDVRLEIEREVPNFLHTVTRRVEIDNSQSAEGEIWIFNSERADFEVKVVLAKYSENKI